MIRVWRRLLYHHMKMEKPTLLNTFPRIRWKNWRKAAGTDSDKNTPCKGVTTFHSLLFFLLFHWILWSSHPIQFYFSFYLIHVISLYIKKIISINLTNKNVEFSFKKKNPKSWICLVRHFDWSLNSESFTCVCFQMIIVL